MVLTDGSHSVYWSSDGARTFHNVSGCHAGCPTLTTPFRFEYWGEGASWKLLELAEEERGMPGGLYYFNSHSVWRSEDSARSWRRFSVASPVGSKLPITNFPYTANNNTGFFFQSEVYRREDGTFLHGSRVPTHSDICDNWDGSQLWVSRDTRAREWECASLPSAGYCTDPIWRTKAADNKACNW